MPPRLLTSYFAPKNAVVSSVPAPSAVLVESTRSVKKRAAPTTEGPARKRPCAAAAAVGVGSKFTPLELQFLRLREENPCVLLAIEVGYKYRFFDDHARIAASVLNVVCWRDKNFDTASVSPHRLPVHVRRLVLDGHLVGIVLQTETAALRSCKRDSDIPSGAAPAGPFNRKLSRLYSRATLIDDDGEHSTADKQDQSSQDDPSQNYIFLVLPPMASGPNLTAYTTFVAFDPSTGDLVYDSFADCDLCLELEMRLAALAPVELVLLSRCDLDLMHKRQSLPTERCLMEAMSRYVRSCRLPIRFVHNRDPVTCDPVSENVEKAMTLLFSEFAFRNTALLAVFSSLPKEVQTCIWSLVQYLRPFGLESAFSLQITCHHFAQLHSFRMSAASMGHLGLFSNSAVGNSVAAKDLYSLLNTAVFPPAIRLLRTWIMRPLVDASLIRARQEASSELAKNWIQRVPMLRKLLRSLGDAQRQLLRIHYGRISPAALYSFLTTWRDLGRHVVPILGGLLSPIFRCAVTEFSATMQPVCEMLESTSREAAMANSKSDLWEHPELLKMNREIDETISQLESTAAAEARLVSGGSVLRSCGTEEFLVQVPIKAAVPTSSTNKTWYRLNATTRFVRYHTTDIQHLLRKKQVLGDRRRVRAKEIYEERLRDFSCAVFGVMRGAINLLAQIDCLACLAELGSRPGYVVPEILDGEDGIDTEHAMIKIQNGRHPVLELITSSYIANSVELNSAGTRALILTGPNMGGKSSLVRMIALFVVLAQMGGPVPCSAARVVVFDGLFTRMGASDDIARGRSTFMVEMAETRKILASATARSLVVLDELGRGTSTHDGTAIAGAVLRHLVHSVRCCLLFVTHFASLVEEATGAEGGGCCRAAHMGYLAADQRPEQDYESASTDANNPRDQDEQRITFLYRLVAGSAGRSYGLNVARLAGLPDSVVQQAMQKSRLYALEDSVAQQVQRLCRLFARGSGAIAGAKLK